MGFYTTTPVTEKPHPETPSCAQKTASGKIFTYPIKTQYKNRHNSLKTNQEKPLPTHETASGVFYYKFRHYSAELGRWLGRDPIEEWGGINLYTFVGNDPLNWWDVLGLSKKKGLPAPLCEDDKNTDDDHEKALTTAINNYKKNWVVTKVKVEGPSPVDCPGQPTTKGESYIVTVRFTKKGVVPGKNLPAMIPTVPDNKPKKGDPPFTGDTVKFPDDFQSKLHIRCCKCCIKDKKGKITIITKCAVAHYEYGTHGPKQGGKDHVFPIPRPDHIPKPKEPKK